jgi:hypothetical protein
MGEQMNENEKVANGRRNGKAAKPPSAPVVDPVPVSEDTPEWTYRGWYEKNREALSKRRKDRYHKDRDYRDKVLEQNKDYRAKKSQEKPAPPKVKVRTPKHRKPVTMKVKISGKLQEVNMVHVGAFARAIGRSVPTIHQWERVGLLPRTPFMLEGKNKQERLYTAEMIGVVRTVLSTRGATISASDLRFRQEIEDGWSSVGVSVGDEK